MTGREPSTVCTFLKEVTKATVENLWDECVMKLSHFSFYIVSVLAFLNLRSYHVLLQSYSKNENIKSAIGFLTAEDSSRREGWGSARPSILK